MGQECIGSGPAPSPRRRRKHCACCHWYHAQWTAAPCADATAQPHPGLFTGLRRFRTERGPAALNAGTGYPPGPKPGDRGRPVHSGYMTTPFRDPTGRNYYKSASARALREITPAAGATISARAAALSPPNPPTQALAPASRTRRASKSRSRALPTCDEPHPRTNRDAPTLLDTHKWSTRLEMGVPELTFPPRLRLGVSKSPGVESTRPWDVGVQGLLLSRYWWSEQ